MKFYATPNLLVRPRKNGVMKRFRTFRFDKDGEYETDNLILIKALSVHFSTVPLNQSEEHQEIELSEELTEEQLRVLAKEKGIKSWHVKSIEKLKEELGV